MWGYIFIFMKETIKREKKGKSFIKKDTGLSMIIHSLIRRKKLIKIYIERSTN